MNSPLFLPGILGSAAHTSEARTLFAWSIGRILGGEYIAALDPVEPYIMRRLSLPMLDAVTTFRMRTPEAVLATIRRQPDLLDTDVLDQIAPRYASEAHVMDGSFTLFSQAMDEITRGRRFGAANGRPEHVVEPPMPLFRLAMVASSPKADI
jgi:hypothetical protein